ncbi:MAG: hypothetical protein ACI9TV_000595 [Sulfurimonas sp.]|jgi:hypothetical protein|uniref:OprD family outer membrane porin n=1 Tax=Sulfurimonas sp. TaxID=2022749 RepID=UPI0039E55A0F
MNLLKLISLSLFGLVSVSHAVLVNEKITLKPSMEVKYNTLPSSVDSIGEVFSEGIIYGRLRTNAFLWNWKNEAGFDNKALGLGGSLFYKTAPLSGISATLGIYTTQNPSWMREDASNVSRVKAGKDTFSRYRVTTSGQFGMSVLGQAYLQYDVSKTSIFFGRQMFESVFTRSNDTKMIPNTFDGLSATIKELPNTTIRLAYLDKQKLRDHTLSHDVIAFAGGSSPDKWLQNDDSGVNRNLTVARIGNDNELLIASVKNTSIQNIKAQISYAMVPNVLSNLTLETHLKLPLTKDWSLSAGFRYMQQFDNLNANYNVSNLLTSHDGYKENAKKSLDTNLLALRLDLKNQAFLGRLGYSHIADKADIVTPWRGFPTGGFTRAMAQYNWYANTKTYMARVGYYFSKAKLLDGFSIMARYAIQDNDDKKAGVPGDSNIVHIDARQNLGDNLELKLRLGFVEYKKGIQDINGDTKADLSYNEYRFEMNYFF